jgi:hypothetical protein
VIYYLTATGNGNSPDGTAPHGAVECTQAQYSSASNWTISGGVIVPATPATPTLAQQAAALIDGGITIASAETPALNGAYATDATAQSNLQAVQIYVTANAKFPGSSGTYPWLDKAGVAHIFPTIIEFTAFATAVADFVADCTMIVLTGKGTLPAATATIS